MSPHSIFNLALHFQQPYGHVVAYSTSSVILWTTGLDKQPCGDTNQQQVHRACYIMKCYFDWTGLTMPCVFDPDITIGWPKRVPVLRGLGETNALQMASHGPFLAWIWAPLHHHTSVIGNSCVNKVSYTTSSDCKETRDIKIAMFPPYTLLKNDDTGPEALQVGPSGGSSTGNDIIAHQGAPQGSTKQETCVHV